RSLVLAAFAARKPVVTANKELLATHGAELFEAAARCDVDLLYEASVGGGIPLVRPLLERLAGERIVRVMGIVNGTTNYILTRMTEDGSSLPDALAQAPALAHPDAHPPAPPAGSRPDELQRGADRRRARRRTDAHRSRRRRGPHGDVGGRRPDRGRPQPPPRRQVGGGRPGPGAPGPPDRRDRRTALLPAPR